MIEINLLPKNLRKVEKRVNLPYKAYIVLLVAFLLFSHIVLFSLCVFKKIQIGSATRTWNEIAPKSKDSAQMREKIKVLEADVNMMKKILARGVVLTDLFSALNNAIPKGLWLERLSYSEDGLVLQGSVVSLSQNEMTIIGKFLQALKSSDEFSLVFAKIELSSVQRRMIKTYDVVDFVLVGEMKNAKDGN
ncbi:MAG: PilN domain-containing protein [Candidatus Omnitrophota bacterium]